jgi:hypothetical protein
LSFLSVPISIFSVRPTRKIGEISANVVIDETTNDTLTITKQPVQQGASITDHAYKEPTVFSTQILFKDNPAKSLSKIYQDLLDLQSSRVPFTIVTPKRIYYNMLISSIGMTTDKGTENALKISLSCQEIIIVSVTTTQVPRTKQKNPGTTGKTENVGKKSALATGFDAFSGLLR